MPQKPEKNELTVIFIGESYLGGMAGSKRIQNVINPFLKTKRIKVANLIIENTRQSGIGFESGNKNGVQYKSILYSLKNPFTFPGFIYKGLQFILAIRRKSNKTILYCYDTPTIVNIWFLVFAKMLGLIVLIDIVEDYALLNRKTLTVSQSIRISLQEFILKKACWYADAVLVISKYLEQLAGQLFKNKIPIFYLPISVDMSLFNNPVLTKTQMSKVFYGGSFGDKDGIPYLLEAFEKVAEKIDFVELILCGKPPKAGMNMVLEQISRSNVKDRIHFLGYLDDTTYYKTMNECDIFCATRTNSEYANAGFPFKLGEMLATGKPVISSNVGDISKFLTNRNNAMIVTPGSSKEIAEALLELLENPELAKQIGTQGRKVAFDSFDAEKLASSLEEFFVTLK